MSKKEKRHDHGKDLEPAVQIRRSWKEKNPFLARLPVQVPELPDIEEADLKSTYQQFLEYFFGRYNAALMSITEMNDPDNPEQLISLVIYRDPQNDKFIRFGVMGSSLDFNSNRLVVPIYQTEKVIQCFHLIMNQDLLVLARETSHSTPRSFKNEKDARTEAIRSSLALDRPFSIPVLQIFASRRAQMYRDMRNHLLTIKSNHEKSNR